MSEICYRQVYIFLNNPGDPKILIGKDEIQILEKLRK